MLMNGWKIILWEKNSTMSLPNGKTPKQRGIQNEKDYCSL